MCVYKIWINKEVNKRQGQLEIVAIPRVILNSTLDPETIIIS